MSIPSCHPENQMPWFEIAIFLLIPLLFQLFKFNYGAMGLNVESMTATDQQQPSMRWLAEDQLPRWAKKQFGRYFDSFIRNGFQHVGYLEVKHRHIKMYDCHFETDGTLTAEISAARLSILPASTTLAMKSLLNDGTVLETTDGKKLPPSVATMANEQHFHLTCAGTKDPEQLRDVHLQQIEQLTVHPDKDVVPLDKDLIPELTQYALNLADQYLHKQGVLAKKPAEFFAGSD